MMSITLKDSNLATVIADITFILVIFNDCKILKNKV